MSNVSHLYPDGKLKESFLISSGFLSASIGSTVSICSSINCK